MFRSSFRSVSDPLREHVCSSCRARGLGGRVPARFFRTTPLSHADSGERVADVASSTATDGALQSVPQSLNSHESESAKDHSTLGNAPENQTANNSTQGQANSSSSESAGTKSPDTRPDGILKTPQKVPPCKPKAGGTKPPGKLLKGPPKSLDGKPMEVRASSKGFPTLAPSITAMMTKKEHGKLWWNRLFFEEVKVETPPVPELSYGLDRVLFNPGVYHLQDPRSRVFNFDPYLGTIMPVTEFDFASLKDYITSSKDTTLRDIAAKHRKKYVGSSSSMTGVLSHFHYLLSQWRPINVQNLSQGFPDNLKTFTALLRAPAAVILRYQDGTYAIDADKEFDSANILMNLGKSMEKLLTLPKEEFERYRRSAENKITPEEEALVPESYHYSTQGDFLMRSQLDAYDPRLPGTGMFDLKTRAVVSIRMDARNFEKGLGYQIKSLFGEFESYEREYYDMIRAAFLKYSLQVRMGRMDGIFVAFHNVERIFGFQYISLPEMDLALHGQRETVLGHAEFRFSLKLWNKILNKATAKYPKRSLRFHFETRLSKDGTTYMNIFYEPVTDEQIEAIQNKNKADIDAYQQQILALEPKEDGQKNTSTLSEHPKDTEDAAETAPTASESSIDRVASPVEEGQMNSALSDDQATVVTKDPAASNVSAESESSVDPVVPSEEDGQDLSSALSDDQTTTKDTDATADNASTASESSSADTAASESKKPRELSGICLTVLNYHNDQRVERIENFKRTDSWTIRYQMSDLEGPNLHSFYESCQRRREQLLLGDRFESEAKVSPYIAKLWRLSKKGRQYREFIDKFDKEMGYRVVDQRAKS